MITEEEYLKALHVVKDYEKQLNISVVRCSCEPVKTKDKNGNGLFVSPWCWKCNTWRNYI
jgi:hypothetical protein